MSYLRIEFEYERRRHTKYMELARPSSCPVILRKTLYSSSSSSSGGLRVCIRPIALTRNGLSSHSSKGVRLVTYTVSSQMASQGHGAQRGKGHYLEIVVLQDILALQAHPNFCLPDFSNVF